MSAAGEPVSAAVAIVSAAGERRVPFARETLLVGRDAQCDVQLDGRYVSRRHIALKLCDGGVVARDLSSNGSFVGGRRLAGEARLAFGDEIEVGDFRLRVLPPTNDGAAPAAAEAASSKAAMAEAATSGPASSTEAVSSEANSAGAASTEAVSAAAEPAPAAVDLADPVAELDLAKRWLRDLLLDSLDLRHLKPEQLEGEALRLRVVSMIDALMDENARRLGAVADRARLRRELTDEVLGLGPLEEFLRDAAVSEVMVIDRATIYVERQGRIVLTDGRFSSDDSLRSAIERIVTPLGRRIDESTPMVDARLKDGSRVNAIIPPLALKGPCLTIRKFPTKRLTVADLIRFRSFDERMARFLERSVIARRNIVVSGGTGSGKTTLLNVLSSAIPKEERIVTIEDAAELSLSQPHVVSLETRPKNMEGKGEYTIRDLVRNSLRMRPDRIVVGECRGGEALDMLQAMNTGHDGSLTTIHSNSPDECVSRLETLVLMSGLDLPTRAIREQIAGSVHIIVQQTRFSDGSRRVTQVSEVVGIQDDGAIRTETIFEFARAPNAPDGTVRGEFRATGYMPSYIEEFVTLGLTGDGVYL